MGGTGAQFLYSGETLTREHDDWKARQSASVELYWAAIFPQWPAPEDRWRRAWLNAADCNLDRVLAGIDHVANAVRRGKCKTEEHASRLVTLHLRYDHDRDNVRTLYDADNETSFRLTH